MSGLHVTVFGPAEGAVAFSVPGAQRSADDQIFLASSDFALSAEGMTIRISRPRTSSSGQDLRVALYRQIYESGMSRLGHSYGVVFDFSGDVPPGAVLISTLEKVMDILSSHCVNGGAFCGYSKFTEFVVSEMEPSFAGISDALFSLGARPTCISIARPTKQRIFHVVGTGWPESCAEVFDWFALTGAGATFDELLIASDGSGVPGPGFAQAQDLRAATADAADYLHEYAVKVATERDSLASELDQVQRQVKHLAADLARTRALSEEMAKNMRRQLSRFDEMGGAYASAAPTNSASRQTVSRPAAERPSSLSPKPGGGGCSVQPAHQPTAVQVQPPRIESSGTRTATSWTDPARNHHRSNSLWDSKWAVPALVSLLIVLTVAAGGVLYLLLSPR